MVNPSGKAWWALLSLTLEVTLQVGGWAPGSLPCLQPTLATAQPMAGSVLYPNGNLHPSFSIKQSNADPVHFHGS